MFESRIKITNPPERWSENIERYLDRAGHHNITKLTWLLVNIHQLPQLQARACVLYWKYLKGY